MLLRKADQDLLVTRNVVVHDARIVDASFGSGLPNFFNVGRLLELDLCQNPVSRHGARALADSTTLTSLQSVSVVNAMIAASGLKALKERFGPGLRVE